MNRCSIGLTSSYERIIGPATTARAQPSSESQPRCSPAGEWFEAHGVAYTAADLVAMTRLALEYELPGPIEDINRPF